MKKHSNQVRTDINPPATETTCVALNTIALLGYQQLEDALQKYLSDRNVTKIKAAIEKTVLSLINNDVLDPSCTARSMRWTGKLVLVGIEIHRSLKTLDAELASYFLKTIQASVRSYWHESQFRTLQDAIADGELPHYTLVPPSNSLDDETDVETQAKHSASTQAKPHRMATCGQLNAAYQQLQQEAA